MHVFPYVYQNISQLQLKVFDCRGFSLGNLAATTFRSRKTTPPRAPPGWNFRVGGEGRLAGRVFPSEGLDNDKNESQMSKILLFLRQTESVRCNYHINLWNCINKWHSLIHSQRSEKLKYLKILFLRTKIRSQKSWNYLPCYTYWNIILILLF